MTTKNEDISDELYKYLEIAKSSGLWLKELGSLAGLELNQSVEACKKLLWLNLSLLPMMLFLYISLSVSLAFIIQMEFESHFLSMATFILSQILAISAVKYKLTKLKKKIGFHQTKHQVMEVRDELLKTAQQANYQKSTDFRQAQD